MLPKIKDLFLRILKNKTLTVILIIGIVGTFVVWKATKAKLDKDIILKESKVQTLEKEAVELKNETFAEIDKRNKANEKLLEENKKLEADSKKKNQEISKVRKSVDKLKKERDGLEVYLTDAHSSVNKMIKKQDEIIVGLDSEIKLIKEDMATIIIQRDNFKTAFLSERQSKVDALTLSEKNWQLYLVAKDLNKTYQKKIKSLKFSIWGHRVVIGGAVAFAALRK